MLKFTLNCYYHYYLDVVKEQALRSSLMIFLSPFVRKIIIITIIIVKQNDIAGAIFSSKISLFFLTQVQVILIDVINDRH